MIDVRYCGVTSEASSLLSTQQALDFGNVLHKPTRILPASDCTRKGAGSAAR